jgi:cytochrome c-type biogenesis protein
MVFIALGASATTIGKLLVIYKRPLSIAAGIIIILLGLHMTGILKIPALYHEKRIHINTKPINFAGAFIVGIAFAFGWTPCIGPILAGILTVAAAQESVGRGILLLSMYSLGLAIPFMITAFSITLFFKLFDKIKKSLNIIEWIAGALLIIVGVLILTGGMTILASWFSSLGS